MKTKITNVVLLVLIAMGSIGCSSTPRVWYWGGKAYATNPETGKVISWDQGYTGKKTEKSTKSMPLFSIGGAPVYVH